MFVLCIGQRLKWVLGTGTRGGVFMCELIRCRSLWMQGIHSVASTSQSHRFMYCVHVAYMAGSHSTSTVWGGRRVVLHPCAVPAVGILHAVYSKGTLWKAHSPESNIMPVPPPFSPACVFHDLHVCGRAKHLLTAFSLNTRKLRGLPVERQGIKF